MKPIIIFGTGGNCMDILDAIGEINLAAQSEVYHCVGFLDDDQATHGKDWFGVTVLGPLSAARDYPDCSFVNGIGSDSNFWQKPDIIAKAGQPLDRFENVIHPTASVSRMARLGRGIVVLQHATVASRARLGNHVIVLPNSIVSHDSTVEDYTSIAGGVCISGGVRIGKSCYLGTNSAIKGNTSIGDNCLIGMGSVVPRDVAENSVMIGNPARFLRKTIPI